MIHNLALSIVIPAILAISPLLPDLRDNRMEVADGTSKNVRLLCHSHINLSSVSMVLEQLLDFILECGDGPLRGDLLTFSGLLGGLLGVSC